MNKGFYLSTCSTCTRILKELDLPQGFELQDIKQKNISEEELDEAAGIIGSYLHLFNTRAQKLKERSIDPKSLKESELRKLILEEYTFLKRPVFIFNDAVFAGNSSQNILALKDHIRSH